jgi:hypothetical protein
MGMIELKRWESILETDTLTVHFTGTIEIAKKEGGFHVSENETHPAKQFGTYDEVNAELVLRGISLDEWW